MTARFCKDCEHIRDAQRTTFEKCAALVKVDVVTGEMKPVYCSTARGIGFECGPEGKLFMPLVKVPA